MQFGKHGLWESVEDSIGLSLVRRGVVKIGEEAGRSCGDGSRNRASYGMPSKGSLRGNQINHDKL